MIINEIVVLTCCKLFYLSLPIQSVQNKWSEPLLLIKFIFHAFPLGLDFKYSLERTMKEQLRSSHMVLKIGLN